MNLQEVRESTSFAMVMIGVVVACATIVLWALFALTSGGAETYTTYQKSVVLWICIGFLAAAAMLIVGGFIGFALNQRSSKK